MNNHSKRRMSQEFVEKSIPSDMGLSFSKVEQKDADNNFSQQRSSSLLDKAFLPGLVFFCGYVSAGRINTDDLLFSRLNTRWEIGTTWRFSLFSNHIDTKRHTMPA
ncbi:hypothetical protein DESC_40135 [Desulfosarcina cetonica]|nr:hypothetical protein DESC_40135 [Desulfosarcina cetonica]